MNQIAALLGCPVVYREERQGDIKHIAQSPARARSWGFSAEVALEDGIWDSFPQRVAA